MTRRRRSADRDRGRGGGRTADDRAGREVANALIDGGVSVIEMTMTVPRAVELIAELSRALPHALIGAGTVTDAGRRER